MNDRGGGERGAKWNRFWDDGRTKLPIEDDDDDDDYGNEVDHDEDDQSNNVGNDIDANNFETFDNAAEWDEDEHEDLIARDKILSRPVVEVQDLEKQMLNIRTQSDSGPTLARPNPWSPFGGQDFFKSTDPGSTQAVEQLISREQNVLNRGQPSLASLELQQIQEQLHQQSQNHAMLLLQRERLLRQQQENDLQTSNIARMLQQQQQQQRFQQQQEALFRQQQLLQQFQQQTKHQEQQASSSQLPKVFTVEELERQMIASRPSELPQPAPLRNSQAPQQQPPQSTTAPNRDRNRKPSASTNAPQMINLVMRQSGPFEQSSPDEHEQVIVTRVESPPKIKPAQIERCLFAAIQAEQEQQQEEQKLKHQQRLLREQRDNRNNKDRYGLNNNNNINGSSSSGNATNFREPHHNHIQNQQHYSNKINNTVGSRDGGRDNRSRLHNRRKYTVLPPQVQLSVLESAKKPDSIKTKYSDEFLQDRMPTSNSGFFFKRLNLPPTNERHIHDGILTDDERSWLTSIQKKIQSDYDNNLEQDYYYMLYFNQTTSNKTPQRGVGASQPALARTLISSGDSLAANGTNLGHQDRRFVARERLLYNS